MPIDTTEARSPGWWLDRLVKKLAAKRDHYDKLDGYYSGTNVIPRSATKQVRQSYQRLMDVSRTNWAELIVEAPRERMQPVGFRTAAGGDELGDKEAWRIYQGNHLDADCSLVHAAGLSMGLGLALVGPVDPDIGVPLITPEDPREVIVETDPRNRRKVIAAAKLYHDDVDGVDVAYVYLPGRAHRAVRTGRVHDGSLPGDASGFEWDGDPIPYPARIVPVVPFANRPKLGREVTRGEFETHLSVLDRINYTVLQRVEIATMQAFRQRAIKGDLPQSDEDGNPIDYNDLFAADPGALWQLPETADIWESGQVDLGPVRQAIRDDIQDLAACTRTPLFYLTPDAANGSAEGASLAREGLIFKVRDRLAEYGESWETVMSHAFRFAGDEERASRVDMEIIWASPERRSLSEMADAGAKALKGGKTLRGVRRDVWGMTPQETAEAEMEDAAEALRTQGVALIDEVMNGAARTDGQPAPR